MQSIEEDIRKALNASITFICRDYNPGKFVISFSIVGTTGDVSLRIDNSDAKFILEELREIMDGWKKNE